MTLNEFAAQKRLLVFDALQKGIAPPEGDYSEALFKEGKTKSAPQMGTTRYEPEAVVLEFIYPDVATTATVFSVRIAPPERIVFLPVPEWVVETIWQGDVDGTFQFESDARKMLELFSADLGPEANLKWFGPRQAKRRE